MSLGRRLLLGSFLLRLLLLPLSITGLNPYAQSDAARFGTLAPQFAAAFERGVVPDVELFIQFVPVLTVGPSYNVWSLTLAPFWLVPGPSGVYARIFLALLGAVAVYNVYALGIHFHSRRAGLLAALPVAVFPSFVLSHPTLLRESAILFATTTLVRIFAEPAGRQWRLRYASVIPLFGLVVLARPDNLYPYLFAIGVGAWVGWTVRRRAYGVSGGIAFASGLGVVVFGQAIVQRAVQFLSKTHRRRTKGATVYLEWFVPETPSEMVAFSWIGVLYFYFTPFPWMVSQPETLVVLSEALVNLAYAIAAFVGARYVIQRRAAVGTGLVVGFVVLSVFYGIGTVNVGTAVRMRQQFVWILYLFGSIYIADRFRLIIDRVAASE